MPHIEAPIDPKPSDDGDLFDPEPSGDRDEMGEEEIQRELEILREFAEFDEPEERE